jgi:hypothetical protein
MRKYERKQLGKSLSQIPGVLAEQSCEKLQDTYWLLTGRRGSLRLSELQLSMTLENCVLPLRSKLGGKSLSQIVASKGRLMTVAVGQDGSLCP